MRVKDLISILQKQNPEALVLASSDSEGNTISKLSNGISQGIMKGEATIEDYLFNTKLKKNMCG